MKKLAKRILVFFSLILLVLVSTIVLLPLLFDLNEHKSRIVAAVENKTGRALEISGDIKLSIFPWLGIELGEVTLGNSPDFTKNYFLKTNQLRLRVKLLPLFRKQLEMDKINIEGLSLNLSRNSSGITNWDNLIHSTQLSKTKTSNQYPLISVLAIGGLSISDATIVLTDEQKGMDLHISGLNLNTGPITPDEPIESSLMFRVTSSSANLNGTFKANGILSFNTTTKTYNADSIVMNADLKLSEIYEKPLHLKITGGLAYNQPSQTVTLPNLKIDIPTIYIGSQTATIGLAGTLKTDLANGTFFSPKITIDGTLNEKNNSEKSTTLSLISSLNADLHTEVISLDDFQLESHSLSAVGTVDVTNLSNKPNFNGILKIKELNPKKFLAEIGQLVPTTHDSSALTQFQIDSVFSGSTDDFQMTQVTARLDDTLLEGDIVINDFSQPAIKSTIAIDSIDINKYLPAGNSMSVTPSVVSVSATNFPLKALRDLDIELHVTADHIKIYNTDLTDIRLGLHAENGLINTSPLEANLYGGIYLGNIAVDTRNDLVKLHINEQLKNVRFGELLTALGGDLVDVDLNDSTGDLVLKANISRNDGSQVFKIRDTLIETTITKKTLPHHYLDASFNGDIDFDLKNQLLIGKNLNTSFQGLSLPKMLRSRGMMTVSSLQADLATKKYKASQLDVDLKSVELLPKTKPVPVNVEVESLNVDLTRQTIEGNEITISTLGAIATGNILGEQILGDTPEITGRVKISDINLKRMLPSFGLTPIQTTDPTALTKLTLDTFFSATPIETSLDPLNLSVDGTEISGLLWVNNSDPLDGLQFEFDVANINADRYFPPGKKTYAATPGLAASTIPTELLNRLKADGRIGINHLIISNITLTGIQIGITAVEGTLRLHPLTGLLYDGAYSGDINISTHNNQMSVSIDEQLKHILVGPLLRDLTGRKELLTGQGDLDVKLTATAKSIGSIKQTMNGQAIFELRDGSMKGVDLINTLCNGLQSAGIFNKRNNSDRTEFSNLKGSVTVVSGLISNQDMDVKSPLLRIGGTGELNLVSEEIDYLANIQLVDTCQGQGGFGLNDLSSFDIPVRIGGTLDKPLFEPDYTKILAQGLRYGIEQQLEKSINLHDVGEILQQSGVGTASSNGAQQNQKHQTTGGSEIIQEGLSPQNPSASSPDGESAINSKPSNLIETPEDVIQEIGKQLLQGLFN